MASYVAVIRKESNTTYWVDAPDIPGYVADGETIEAAKTNFSEALALHLREGDDPNMRRPPRPLEEIDAEELEGAVETYLIELRPTAAAGNESESDQVSDRLLCKLAEGLLGSIPLANRSVGGASPTKFYTPLAALLGFRTLVLQSATVRSRPLAD